MLPPFWDYRREYDELRDEILAAVDRVFKSGQLILGPADAARSPSPAQRWWNDTTAASLSRWERWKPYFAAELRASRRR